MARVLGPNFRDGSSLFFRWVPFLPPSIDALMKDSRTPIHPNWIQTDVAEALKEVKFVIDPPKKGGVPEIMGNISGPFIISVEIRNWLEAHEPARFAFHEINVVSTLPIDGKLEHGVRYVLGDVPILEPLDVEQTAWAGGMYGKPDGRTMASHPDAPCVAFKSAIKGHHFWKTSHRQGLQIMCSEEFWQFLRTNKYRGFDTSKHCKEI